MNRILTAAEMFHCDRTEIETNTPSRVLMERASRACADAVRALLQSHPLSGKQILFLCGSGNNGGDGILCAHMLYREGIPAVICPAFRAEDSLSPECAYRYKEALAAGVPMLSPQSFLDAASDTRTQYGMIVDALFGIGLTREVGGIYADLIDAANAQADIHHIPTVALDIASGIFADTGKVSIHTFRAAYTLAINHIKRGHLLYPGAAYTGALTLLDIGIPDAVLSQSPEDFPVYALTDDDACRLLPRRRPDSNKGTNGRILIAAGARNMCGAAYLSALAAYRCGAGLVEIFTCEDNRIPLHTLLPEAILTTYDPADPDTACAMLQTAMRRASAIVIGPGLGTSDTAAALVKTVLSASTVPTVLDADALNLSASLPEGWCPRMDKPSSTEGVTLSEEDRAAKVPLTGKDGAKKIPLPAKHPPFILTPHPGELSRLTGQPIADCLSDLIQTARQFAVDHDVILNAKNTRSIITDGRCAFINPTGTSALAKGGSGDVLSGITATLAAQGCDPLTAAALAAFLHGRAAEAVSARMGTRAPLASEIADALGEVTATLDRM